MSDVKTHPDDKAPNLYRGVSVPASYGDSDTEYAALTTDCAAVVRRWSGGLVMTGEDRHRFLNSQVTCEIKDLAAGTGVFGFFVSAKGRVEADVTVLALPECLWLELPRGTEASIGERIDKYKVIDRVEIEPLEQVAITLAGPRAVDLVDTRWSDPSLAPLEHVEVQVAGGSARLVQERDFRGSRTWTLWVSGELFEAAWQEITQGADAATPVGWQAYDRWRLEGGRPAFGLDFGPDCFPQETGLAEQGISYTKGCYLGQEVVARIHYRGGVQRRMCHLQLDAPAVSGLELRADGKKVGRLGSVAAAADGILGLAVVHQKAEDGARLEVVDGDGEPVAGAIVASV